MRPNQYDIAALISKYLRNNLSEEEGIIMQQWLDEKEENKRLLESFRDGGRAQQDIDFIGGINVGAAWVKMQRRQRQQRVKRIIRYTSYAAAVLIFAGAWLWFSPSTQPSLRETTQTGNVYHNDVLPGGNKAQLMLSDGRAVDLEAYLDELRERDGTEILGGEGQLTYSNLDLAVTELIYNTIVVPKAGTFQLTLSDGTKVWINAMSELRFPVQFDEQERIVHLKGEAYFEVAHDADRPFVVEVNGTQVEVLGTHFNINSYAQVTTTLVKGAVRVSNETGEQLLKPGQEARVGERITLHAANIAKTMAWKNGDFYFRSDNIQDIMGQLSRWYDFEIHYKGDIPSEGYNGNISRAVNLSEVLEMLSYASGTVFEVNGRQVVVKF